MLILTRKPGESLYIGDEIKVTIVEIKGNQIRVGIEAPVNLRIYREEIYVQILEENVKAAESSGVPVEGLEGLSDAWRGRKGDSEAPSGGEEPRVQHSLASVSTGTVKPILKGRSKIGSAEPKGEGKSSPQVQFRRKRLREDE